MPQRVPEFRFDADALAVRQFLYEFWCAHGYGPNLRLVHEGTGLSRERILEAYRQLDLGLVCVIDHRTENANLLKLQPFSSYPSQVQIFLDGRPHGWAGCAMESIALSRMPPFAGREIRLESYCACCLAPVRLVTRDGAILAAEPAGVLVHVSTTPREWARTNIVCMCDSSAAAACSSPSSRPAASWRARRRTACGGTTGSRPSCGPSASSPASRRSAST